MSTALFLACCFAAGAAWAWLWSRILRLRPRLFWVIAGVFYLVVVVAIFRSMAIFAACAGHVAFEFWRWWHSRRRDRKRSESLLGAKSRALRDQLVRKAREAARPSPVRRPALGGAG